ncbi:hypothetical protein SDRG_12183 [Saprolegnia diclina VS20]|uniref:Uncharacterized protein n=1 Tax=Saprolegnia diclina (strain VS20) TaxID=1156394 RepID=T0Q9H0_SAPDV|nr:hypothetical protein SDRG_12183 [Saprolegnia diclina VS20]EQC30125.1 hypothetical protein SDRG_12183 [Saprolegnia diclina VS20]|eukprot:XP_008616468.1 hypothetical protein SDRG_12183 [Saprolegnia diclina VS20]
MAKQKAPKSRAAAKDAAKKMRSSPNTRTATYFNANGFPNISQTTVSRMVRDEARWRTMAEKTVCLEVVRERPVRYVDDEDA